MFTSLAKHLLGTVLVVILGTLTLQSLAADRVKASDLSITLGQVKIFSGLTAKERALLESAAALRQGKEGERIIEQGKPTGRMFIILKGEVKVRVNDKPVAALPAQSLIGEVEFLDGLPASADVVIQKDTFLIELNNAALKGLMRKQPRLGYVLMSEIAAIEAQRLRAMNQKVDAPQPAAPTDRK